MEQKKDIPGGEQISGDRITVAGFQEKTVRHVKTLVRCEYQKTKDVTIPVHSHPGCAELTYHKWGRQRYEVDGRIYDIHAGDMFLAYPDELHSSGPYPEERSGFYYLLFEFPPDAEEFMGLSPEESDWIRQTLLSCRDRRKFRGTPEIPQLLNRILDIYENDDSSMQDCRIRALLIQFFYLVCRSIRQSRDGLQGMPTDFARLTRQIAEHPESTRSVSELADSVFLSESHFKRKFKEYTGYSPYDFIVRQKVLRARQLLLEPNRTVTDVATRLNFCSSQHFSLVFRKYTGMTPTQYRQSGGQGDVQDRSMD